MKKTHEIKVEIFEQENIFNPYNHNLLSYDLGKYLYNSCALIRPREAIIINIKLNYSMNMEEKEEMAQTIAKNYKFYLKKEKKIQKYDSYKKVFLFIIGICLIYLTRLLSSFDLYLVKEILLISGWVAIWEVIYSILFVDTKRELKLRHLKQLASSKIIFDEEREND